MAKAHKVNPDGDAPPRDARDYQRLRDQARMWQGATAEVLDRVGLGPGMSCLDVGCGPGAVMRLMADRVGHDGCVTGIEIDAALGAETLQQLRAEGGSQFELLPADLLKLKTPAGAPFDLTFCRLLLMQMRDPVAILEKMSAWTKPGGVVVAQEFDFGAIAVEPTCPAMGEFNRVFEGVFRGHGRNMRAGRQLPAQFEAAGLGTPDGTEAAVHYLPLSEMANMLIGVYDGLYATGVEIGLADPERASAFRADMTEAGADGRYYCLTPVLIAAWKHIR
ncbi:MAG TPA: methyltransferase domain-containing protein [Methyloceanibacter sp.]|jgi:SAM-dependent methyltransferase|nr:methyltransferase domain-containing protein [Methyloceanibacter sp.]